MPKVVALSEKPTLRTAPAPLLRLSEAVRAAGIKVVLTGEGADELFAGYDIFKLDAVRRFWARQPDSKSRPLLLRRLYPYLAHDLGRAGGLLQNVFRGDLRGTDDPLYSHRLRFSSTARCLRFFSKDLLDQAAAEMAPGEALLERLPADFSLLSGLAKAQYLEVHTFLSGYLLHSQGDRMLMGNSIEGRFPFLDYRVAEFAAQLPDGMRLRRLQEKYLLRKAVRSLLPSEIAKREKRPYRAPILRAFVGPEAPEYVDALLEPAHLEKTGVFAPTAVDRLMQKCRRSIDQGVGETDEMALVGILSVMLLHEQLVAHPCLAPSARPGKVVIGATTLPSPLSYRGLSHEQYTPAPLV